MIGMNKTEGVQTTPLGVSWASPGFLEKILVDFFSFVVNPIFIYNHVVCYSRDLKG